jgi:hypothetical protein
MIQYVIILTPMPGGVPPILRLRSLLKACKRRHGLKAICVKEIPDDAAALQSEPPAPKRKAG